MSVRSRIEHWLWNYLWTRPVADGVKDSFEHQALCAQAERNITNRWRDWAYQFEFLLSQAPMIDAPTDKARLEASRTAYAYISPETFRSFAKFSSEAQCAISHGRSWFTAPSSPTRYVITKLMPDSRIIYSSNPIPVIEKFL